MKEDEGVLWGEEGRLCACYTHTIRGFFIDDNSDDDQDQEGRLCYCYIYVLIPSEVAFYAGDEYHHHDNSGMIGG